jgi:hypothetical protein
LLPDINSAGELKSELMKYVIITTPGSELFNPGKDDIADIKALAESKYTTWEWNYAYGPAYRFTNRFEFRGKAHCCDLNVKDGIITASRITGSEQLELPGREMVNLRHHFPDVAEYFDSLFPDEGRELTFGFF